MGQTADLKLTRFPNSLAATRRGFAFYLLVPSARFTNDTDHPKIFFFPRIIRIDANKASPCVSRYNVKSLHRPAVAGIGDPGAFRNRRLQGVRRGERHLCNRRGHRGHGGLDRMNRIEEKDFRDRTRRDRVSRG